MERTTLKQVENDRPGTLVILVFSIWVLQNCIAQGSRLATGLCNRRYGV